MLDPILTYLPWCHTVTTTVRAISDALESLQVIASMQSFFLVVNPNDAADEGFLGGTLLGREFWRGHRGCGAPGAQAFKLFCKTWMAQMDDQYRSHASTASQSLPAVAVPQSQVSKRSNASAVKSEVYASVRHAVRCG